MKIASQSAKENQLQQVYRLCRRFSVCKWKFWSWEVTLKLQFAWQGKKRQLGYAVFKFSRTVSVKKAAETSTHDFVFKVQQFPEMHYLKIEIVLFSQVWLKLLSARECQRGLLYYFLLCSDLDLLLV